MSAEPSRFNLIDEAWIPVRKLDGARVELGIRDTLRQAKEIAVIEDPSPLVTASLHRFLLAVLYRALEGPTDIYQAKTLFRVGLPADKIDAYLDRWRDRFWLFDEAYPFGQNPNIPATELEPWTKLTAEHNATSNKVLFDHTDAKAPGARSFAECARWLVSTMTFSLSGGRGYFPSPSVNGLMCIPVGANLHETLCYCLIDQNRTVIQGDIPLWERHPEELPLATPKRAPAGNADLFSWQARLVFLEACPTGGVAFVRFIAGLGHESTAPIIDPMLAYTTDKEKGRLPLRFHENRGIWRDFDSLLPGAGGEAPLTIQHSIRLAGHDPCLLPKSILTLGLRYTPPNANVDFWRMETFALPERLASDVHVRSEIRQLLTDAEQTESALDAALRDWAKSMITKCDRELQNDKWASGRWIPGDVSKAIGKTSPDTPPAPALTYWSAVEAAFHDMLRLYTAESDPETIRHGWLKTIRQALHDAWQRHAASVAISDAWAIRALVRAEAHVNRQRKALEREIQKYETYRQAQETTA